MKSTDLLAGLLLASFTYGPLKSQTDDYLADMPSVVAVREAISGENPLDEIGREALAFTQLHSMISMVMMNPNELSPSTQEQALMSTYHKAVEDMKNEAKLIFQDDDELNNLGFADYVAWAKKYFLETPVNPIGQEVRNKLFTPSLQKRYNEHLAIKQSQRNNNSAVEIDPKMRELRNDLDKQDQLRAEKLANLRKSNYIYAAVLFLISIVPFLFLLRKQLRQMGYRIEGNQLITNRGEYRLYYKSGIAKDISNQSVVTTYVQQSGYRADGSWQPGSSSQSTLIRNNFFLESDDGKTLSIQLVNWNFPVGENHKVLVLWAIKEGDSEGPFIMARNISALQQRTGMPFYHMLWPRYGLAFWGGILLTAGACVVNGLTAVTSTPAASGSSGGFFIAFVGLLLSALACAIAYVVGYHIAKANATIFSDSVKYDGIKLTFA